MSGFILIDEDFFLFEQRAREFLECVRSGGMKLSLMGFGSVRGLSKFTADEIAEMGFDMIWTAFEGTKAGYGKLEGVPIPELYRSLNSRGVSVLSSVIVGFPYQDREIILEEFDQLMKLAPSMTQILIYFAFPGTPFHKEVIAENRYLPEYKENPDLRRWDGFAMHFKHPNFSAAELEALQRELYDRDFKTLGPSLTRMISVWLEGYKNLRNSDRPLLKARAARLWESVLDAVPAIVPAMLFGPTRETRAGARRLFAEIRREGKLPMLKTACLCSAIVPLAVWTWLAKRLGIFQQPALLRIEHRTTTTPRPETPVTRLQGGFHANPLRVLLEDMTRGARGAMRRLSFWRRPRNDDFSTSAATRLPPPPERKLVQIRIPEPPVSV